MDHRRFGFIVAAALTLAASGAWGQTPKDVINLDFSKVADQKQMTVNGDARYDLDPTGKIQRLRLTSDTQDSGTAFFTTPVQLSDYLVSFDFEMRRVSPTDSSPLGGFTFLAQDAGPTVRGGSGAGIGMNRNTGSGANYLATSANVGGFKGYSYAIEFNTDAGNGLSSQQETTGFDLLGIRTLYGIAALKLLDQGVYHADLRVKPDQITLTLSNTTQGMKPTVVVTSPTFLCGFFNAPDPLYFGFTGGTTNRQIAEVLNFRIQTGVP